MPTLKNGDICASSPFFELNIDQLYVGTQVASAKPDLCFVKDKMVNKYFFFWADYNSSCVPALLLKHFCCPIYWSPLLDLHSKKKKAVCKELMIKKEFKNLIA